MFPHQTARILGLITPLGNMVAATWTGVMAGRSGAGPVTKFDASDFPVRFACEVKDFEEKKEARKMGAFTHYAIAASDQALADRAVYRSRLITQNASALTAAAASATFGARIKTGHHSSQIKSTFRHLTISSHVVLRHKPPKQSENLKLS